MHSQRCDVLPGRGLAVWARETPRYERMPDVGRSSMSRAGRRFEVPSRPGVARFESAGTHPRGPRTGWTSSGYWSRRLGPMATSVMWRLRPSPALRPIWPLRLRSADGSSATGSPPM